MGLIRVVYGHRSGRIIDDNLLAIRISANSMNSIVCSNMAELNDLLYI